MGDLPPVTVATLGPPFQKWPPLPSVVLVRDVRADEVAGDANRHQRVRRHVTERAVFTLQGKAATAAVTAAASAAVVCQRHLPVEDGSDCARAVVAASTRAIGSAKRIVVGLVMPEPLEPLRKVRASTARSQSRITRGLSGRNRRELFKMSTSNG
jgi:hypothetical protein